MRWLLSLVNLGVGLWTGALFGFAILTAPVVFRVVNSNTLAGQVTQAVLGTIDAIGFAVGAVAVLVYWLAAKGRQRKGVAWLRPLLAAVMLLVSLYAHSAVVGRMAGIQARMDRPIDQLPKDDPLRAEFDRVHQQSRSLYGVVLLAGMALLVLAPEQSD